MSPQEEIEHHTRHWLRLQRLITGNHFDNVEAKKTFLKRQEYHAEVYCALQPTDVLADLRISEQKPPEKT